jgi:glucan biosynthesis protein C
MPPTASPMPSRLFFFDWVRILAFFVLILYHVGMYYVTWDWHVKSAFASDTLEPYMQLSAPWRLGLLFLVSGVASRFLLAKAGTTAFMRQRSGRLLVPLLFGMLVIVPPQAYFEVVEKLAYTGSYTEFMGLYLTGYGGFCREDCLVMPTWNHLWFVAYLWVYTLALAVLAMALGPRFDGLSRRLGQLLTGWKIIVLPFALLALARMVLLPHFEQTHALVDDWYSHAAYFSLFLLGALLGPVPGFWDRLVALRWTGLATALACWCVLTIWYALPHETMPASVHQPCSVVARAVYMLCAWSAVVAACGFARRHLEFDSPARRYLAEAVFPVYIVHQTLIVSLAHLLKPVRRTPGLEAVILVVLTVALSFGIFEVVRRIPALRPLFGLARKAAPSPAHPVEDAHYAGAAPLDHLQKRPQARA